MYEATTKIPRMWQLSNLDAYKTDLKDYAWIIQQLKNRDDDLLWIKLYESTVKKLNVKMVQKSYKDPISVV
jgi:hypothetical protein